MKTTLHPIAGFHDDGWLEIVSTANLPGEVKVVLDFFLPTLSDNRPKKLSVFIEEQITSSHDINRGEVTRVELSTPPSKDSLTARFEFEYAEAAQNDVRSLGCILVDYNLIGENKIRESVAKAKEEHVDESIFGFLQKVEKSSVRGWIASRKKRKSAPKINIVINGSVFSEGVICEKKRQDVERKHPECSVWGFEVILPSGALGRENNVVQVFECSSSKELSGSPRDADGNFELRLRGAIDLPRFGVLINGWAAYSPPIRTAEIVVSIDNEEIGIVKAKSYRRDLDLKQIGVSGHAAFELMVPSKFIDGKKHKISIHESETKKLITSREGIEFSQKKDYTDYSDFLHWAYFNRETYAPFSEADKRVFAHCDFQKEYFARTIKAHGSRYKFSVIMPTYNRAHTIGAAIESVLAQTYADFQLVIVDDGGSDETEDVVSLFSDERIEYIKLDENAGVSKARNIGLEVSTGDIICYLDSDNFWDEDFLAVMAYGFAKNPEFDSAFCGQFLYRGGSKAPYAARLGPFNTSLLENRNYLDLNAFAHRRLVYIELGGFDESLRRLVDWDLILRYTRNKKPFFIPCLLSHYIFNDTNDSITNKEDYASAVDAFDRKNLATHEIALRAYDNTQEQEAFLRPIFSESRSEIARKNNISIIVPSFNIPEVLDISVSKTLETMGVGDELIIVDNGSSLKTQRVLSKLSKADHRVKVIRNSINQGFSRAINQGVGVAASNNDLVIFNNDAIPFGFWIDTLASVLHSDDAIGAVVPQQVLLPGTQTMLTHAPFANPNREVDVNISAHHLNIRDLHAEKPQHEVDLKFAPFFCVMIKREIFEEVGGLNERLGAHYRSDRNFCNALLDTLKKRLVYVHGAKVYHLLQRSTRDLMLKDTNEFQSIFMRNSLKSIQSDAPPIWDQAD